MPITKAQKIAALEEEVKKHRAAASMWSRADFRSECRDATHRAKLAQAELDKLKAS
jgi:hypothetical protein